MEVSVLFRVFLNFLEGFGQYNLRQKVPKLVRYQTMVLFMNSYGMENGGMKQKTFGYDNSEREKKKSMRFIFKESKYFK